MEEEIQIIIKENMELYPNAFRVLRIEINCKKYDDYNFPDFVSEVKENFQNDKTTKGFLNTERFQRLQKNKVEKR